MNYQTIQRWLTAREAEAYCGFSTGIINDAVREGQIASNLVFRTKSGEPERLIDRHSLDEWIGNHVPVPCSVILTRELLHRIPSGCYVARNSSCFGVHLHPGVCREEAWQDAVDRDAAFRICYVTNSAADFDVLMRPWNPEDREEFEEQQLLMDQFRRLDDQISLYGKVS
jgi:hypothetical protein